MKNIYYFYLFNFKNNKLFKISKSYIKYNFFKIKNKKKRKLIKKKYIVSLNNLILLNISNLKPV